jgi:hypothetical protein
VSRVTWNGMASERGGGMQDRSFSASRLEVLLMIPGIVSAGTRECPQGRESVRCGNYHSEAPCKARRPNELFFPDKSGRSPSGVCYLTASSRRALTNKCHGPSSQFKEVPPSPKLES